MFNKLIPLAIGALLVVACGEDASIPTDNTTVAVVGSDDQTLPRHRPLLERLEAEGDAESLALLERAREARMAAKEAFHTGDTATARAQAEEAREYLHQAIERTFPDLAARIEQRKAERGVWSGHRLGEGEGEGRHRQATSQLRAEADDETVALLDQAAAARMAAKEAHHAGNEEEAKRQMQEARAVMHQAITRINPDMAAKMEAQSRHRMERHGKTLKP